MANTQNQKDLEMLKNSFLMYENTKKETEKNMRTATNPDGTKKWDDEKIKEELDLIETAESEIVQKYVLLGGKEEDLKKKKRKTTTKKAEDETIIEVIARNKEENTPIQVTPTTEDVKSYVYQPQKFETNPQASYDVIPIPSKGECYKHKIGKVPVAYLTAYDENMIIAPNLYKDKKILDVMLREKVLNSNIDVEDMLEGDREAILIFLRASGYGNEYPITATDNETGISFDTTFDLSTLKFKEFNLKGDENGWFDFKLPVCGKDIKFKFLTHKDNVTLERLEDIEEAKTRKERIKDIVATLDTFIESDSAMEAKEKANVRRAIRDIERWEEGIDEEDTLPFTHMVTNRLELSIMEVDGVTDRRIIHDFVRNMNVKDSTALRRYIAKNEPGIDYNIEIEKPASLGGGSLNLFLQLDEYLFLNIAEQL